MVGEQIFPSNGSYNENQNDPLQCVACGIKILFLKAGFVDRLRGDFRAEDLWIGLVYLLRSWT